MTPPTAGTLSPLALRYEKEVNMKRCPVILALLVLGGCASVSAKAPSPPTVPPDPWGAVMALDRGTAVIVIVASSDRADTAHPEGATIIDGGYRLAGTLAEVNAGGILVRPEFSLAEPSAVPRQALARLFVREQPSITRGVAALIGGGAGIGLCAAAGLYGEEDIVFSGKVMISGMCGGGGALIGYFLPRKPPTPKLVYSRATVFPSS